MRTSFSFRKDEGRHDFVQIEFTGNVAKRETVRRHVGKAVYAALLFLGYSVAEAKTWGYNVPDYDTYDKTGCDEVHDETIYDGEKKANGWSVWDETRDCCNGRFLYVYYGFSVC